MVIFIFFSNFHSTFCKQTVETLIRRHILLSSDLGLHFLPMSHRKDAIGFLYLMPSDLVRKIGSIHLFRWHKTLSKVVQSVKFIIAGKSVL